MILSTDTCNTEKEDEMWVFGYGSLIWKADFPYECRVAGYVRRFWQGSNDHRGTIAHPGRVVTLIPISEYTLTYAHLDTHKPSPHVYGVAYKIAAVDIESVRLQLDHRERNGYEVFETAVLSSNGGHIASALVYVATTSNPSFLGPEAIHFMIDRICCAQGMSGRNCEYVFGLSEVQKIICDEKDEHVDAIQCALLERGMIVDTSVHGAITSDQIASLQLLMSNAQSKL